MSLSPYFDPKAFASLSEFKALYAVTCQNITAAFDTGML